MLEKDSSASLDASRPLASALHLRLFEANVMDQSIIKMRLFIIFLTIFFHVAPALAKEDALGHRVFVVETDDESSSQSLDRISGQIDLGFASSEQTFESADHYTPGPFARQKQSEKV